MPSVRLLGLALAATVSASPTVSSAKPWINLFDGRTLDGWVPKVAGQALGENYRDTFTVRNGAIRVGYEKYDAFGNHFGHLFYHVPFTAYRLRFKYRFFGDDVPGAAAWQRSNSGLMLFAQAPATMTQNQYFPVSVEMQLLGKDGAGLRPSGNICSPGTNVVIEGVIEPKHCRLSSSPTIPNGRWVAAELDVRPDGSVIHYIDGRAVMRYSGVRLDPQDKDAAQLIAAAGGRMELRSGYIALQSEGHPIEFKDIRIRVYPVARQPAS